MKMTWSSRKGKSRRLNNDAVALAYAGDFLIAIVVDAAEKTRGNRLLFGLNPQGNRLAAHWADSCAHTLASAPERLTSEQQVIDQLAVLQKSLRQYYLHDIASYGVLILHRQSGAADWYFTGDCRLGIESAQGDVEWLGTPHRAENVPTLPADNSRAASPGLMQAARHTLTRSLNAKRFAQPELLKTRLAPNTAEPMKFLIATDGYWCEQRQNSQSCVALNDDASLLTIAHGPQSLTLSTDAPNALIDYRKA
jgi:hypothetical protein